MRRIALALALFSVAMSPGAATADFVDDYAALLSEARIDEAVALAEADAGVDAPGTAALALGAARFAAAVEGLIQGLHRYGLASEFSNAPLQMAGLPFLRLPAPENPAPETVTYAGLRALLVDFAAGLDAARAALEGVPAQAPDAATQLPLDLATVRLDLDGDGDPDGSLIDLMARVAGPAGAFGAIPERFAADFDAADAAWLAAYSHLLGGLAEILLAHDWEASFDATFAGLFPRSFPHDTAIARQARERREAFASLGPLPTPPACARWEDDPVCAALWLEFESDPAIGMAAMLGMEGRYASIADLVAFVHLLRWPVAEPARMAAALAHLEGMATMSRETARRIAAETDDRAEWIPAPGQSGVVAGLPIDETTVVAWMGVLDEIDEILAGRLLVPHWRFEQGVNLRRMFLEPGALDLVLILQGAGVEPYLEPGPVADARTWEALSGAFGGRFLPYAIWLN